MLDEPESITLEYARELKVWTCAWFDEAIAANLMRPPYHPDSAIIKRVLGYFHAGLSPAEAAHACFGRRH